MSILNYVARNICIKIQPTIISKHIKQWVLCISRNETSIQNTYIKKDIYGPDLNRTKCYKYANKFEKGTTILTNFKIYLILSSFLFTINEQFIKFKESCTFKKFKLILQNKSVKFKLI